MNGRRGARGPAAGEALIGDGHREENSRDTNRLNERISVTEASCTFTRRRLLWAGVGFAAAAFLPSTPTLAASSEPVRDLSFRHLHTGETVNATFWRDGAFHQPGLKSLQHVMRDWRNGEEHPIDERLYDLLYALRKRMDSSEPFEIISAYRSPATNANLRKKSNGVAKKSLHMRGMAIDVRLPGRQLAGLRDAAWDLQSGGVGYYPKSGFIHIDTGRVRRWG